MKTKLSHCRISPFSLSPIFLFSLFLIFAFSACSVEKRRYMDGYHVEWRKKTETATEEGTGTGTGTGTKTETSAEVETRTETQLEQTEVLEQAENEIILDSTTARMIEHDLFVRPVSRESAKSNPINARIKKLLQDPEDPEIVRKFKRNKIIMAVAFILGSTLLSIAIVLAFYLLLEALTGNSTVNEPVQNTMVFMFLGGLGLTIVGIITAIAHAILKGKYPGLNNVNKKSKSGDDYVEEPVYTVGEPQPISKEVRKRHNLLYWSSTLIGTLFFICSFFTYALIKDGRLFGVTTVSGYVLVSLLLIGICIFLLWAWVQLRKKKKAYLDEHPELMVIPSK
ncbi:MAG: hypothetical protein ACOYLH_02735 [Flavobacteriales bacterium]